MTPKTCEKRSQFPPLQATSTGEQGKTWHVEVKSPERDHVEGPLSEIGIQLTGESKARGDTAHGGVDQLVQVSVGEREVRNRVTIFHALFSYLVAKRLFATVE